LLSDVTEFGANFISHTAENNSRVVHWYPFVPRYTGVISPLPYSAFYSGE